MKGESTIGSAKNQVLRIAEMNEASSLDPAKVVDNGSFILLNNVQEGLMRLKNKQPVEGIAENVNISSDQLTYTFTLRKDAKWSDGKPITAQDFEFGWKRVLDPKTKSSYSFILFPIQGAKEYHDGIKNQNEVGITSLDPHTLVVKLKEPMLNFLSLTTLPAYLPQRQDLVTKFGDKYATTSQNTVYSGPFVVKEFNRAKTVLTKNDRYWDRNNVSLQQVELRLVKNIDTAVQLYQSNQVDIAPVNRKYIGSFKDSSELKIVERATSYYLVMNQQNKFLANPNIRRAINLSINRQKLTDQILRDGSKPAGALIHPAISGIGNKSFRQMTKKEWVRYQPQQAKALLAKGLSELNMDKPPDEIHLLSYDDEKREVAIAVKKQLQDILGLQVQIDSVTSKEKIVCQNQGKFDIAVSSWGADYNDPIAYLELWSADRRLNIARFKDKEFNDLLEKSKKTVLPEEKIKHLSIAEKKLIQDQAVIVPLFYRTSSFLQKPYVQDFYNHAIGADYSLKWTYLSSNHS
jgi:oligopeptide transport system substrate-binding protein